MGKTEFQEVENRVEVLLSSKELKVSQSVFYKNTNGDVYST